MLHKCQHSNSIMVPFTFEWRFADGKCEEQILLGTIVNNADRDEVKNSIHIQQIRISILLAFSLANFVFWLIYPGKFEKRGKCC